MKNLSESRALHTPTGESLRGEIEVGVVTAMTPYSRMLKHGLFTE